MSVTSNNKPDDKLSEQKEPRFASLRKRITAALLQKGLSEAEALSTATAVIVLCSEPLHKLLVSGIVVGAEFLLIDLLSAIPIKQVMDFVEQNSTAIKRVAQGIVIGADFVLDGSALAIVARSAFKVGKNKIEKGTKDMKKISCDFCKEQRDHENEKSNETLKKAFSCKIKRGVGMAVSKSVTLGQCVINSGSKKCSQNEADCVFNK